MLSAIKIILIMKQQTPILKTEPQFETIQISPGKEEWALINKFKALQFQKIKEKERLIDRQKKINFRMQLDNQLNNKNNVHQQEIEEDRRYYEFITRKSEEMRTRQQQQKLEKYLKRKRLEEENQYTLEATRNSRVQDKDNGYHLDIGQRSQFQRRQKSATFKKEMMDTLDIQLKQKTIQAYRNKIRNIQLDEMNNKYQMQMFDKRGEGKHYGQNPNVYKYYQQLDQQKNMKERQLERRFIDEAMAKKQKDQLEKSQIKELKLQELRQQMKQTLDQQVRALNKKKYEQSITNPEELTYGVISNVFRKREIPYDKNKYVADLKMQAEEQKQRKLRQNHMSQQQYRINMNQLNKIVNGNYNHENYIDRSMGSIGDNKKYGLDSLGEKIRDDDANIIKQKLQNLKNRGRVSYAGSSSHDRSF